jgi:hypothetical protein
MANRWYADTIVSIDNASGSTARITTYVTNHSIQHALNLMDQTGGGVTTHSFLPGLAGATLSISFIINSTTSAIFGPLVGNRTSVTKTLGLNNGVKWFKGEVWPNNVQVSGSPDNLEVGSADLTFEGAVSYTSTGPT